HFDFFEDDPALAGDVGDVENGIEHQVTENVERGGKVFVEDLDAEADTFFGGEGVDGAANGVDLPGNLLRRPVFGAFERHLLHEMRDAVPLFVFVPRTGLDPYSDRDRADVLHLLGDHTEAVGEHRTSDIALGIHRPTIVTHWERPWGIIDNLLSDNDLHQT